MRSPAVRLLDRLVTWIEPADNPSAVVYGTLAVGLLVAAEEPKVETYPRVVSATAVAVVLYWLAHGYAAVLGERFVVRRPATWSEAAAAARHEWAIVKGAASPLLALLAAWAAGAGLSTAVTAAVWTAVVAVSLLELVAGLRAGLAGPQLLGSAVLGAAFGGALLLVKFLLH